MKQPLSPMVQVIAVAGGSGSGKTTFARRVLAALGPDRATILSQDSYYVDQSARFKEDGGEVNFDHPDALDFALMATHLHALRLGQTAEIPRYDFASHKRLVETSALEARPVILVDGTLILSRGELRPHFDLSYFLDIAEEVRFERRFRRDTRERGRQPEGVRRQFLNQVKPMHDLYVQPSCTNATHILRDETTIAEHLAALLKRLAP